MSGKTHSGTTKVSKESVNYRDAHPKDRRKCATCTMYNRLSNTCTLVKGYISPKAVCNRWVKLK